MIQLFLIAESKRKKETLEKKKQLQNNCNYSTNTLFKKKKDQKC